MDYLCLERWRVIMKESTHTDIWKKRADKFNNINWVTDKDLLDILYRSLNLKENEKVLDVGIGTGILSKYILDKSPGVRMYGVDFSKEMIDLIDDRRIEARVSDASRLPFINGLFDVVIFRMLLHHCVGELTGIINETLRVLKDGGRIIICEGIPINKDCMSDFAQIVTLKENRLVFSGEEFISLLHKFHDISAVSITLKQQSIVNWLDNCIDDDLLKAEILNKHHHASQIYKDSSNMTLIEKDILVDMKFIIVRAVK